MYFAWYTNRIPTQWYDKTTMPKCTGNQWTVTVVTALELSKPITAQLW